MKKINLKGAALKVAGTGAGAYAAIKLNKISFVANLSPVIRGVAKIGIGALLPGLLKQKPGSIADHAGNGMIAIGALELASKFDTSISISGFPTVGKIYYDEAYQSGLNNSTMGSADDSDDVDV